MNNMTAVKETFHSKVKLFQTRGMNFIGNFRNTVVAVLDQEGWELVNQIHAGHNYSIRPSTEELYEFLADNDFFAGGSEHTYEFEGAYVHVTNKCNLHCVGCYSLDDKRNKETDLDKEAYFSIFDLLCNVGVKAVVISGGEPLMYKNILELLDYARNVKKLRVTLITNGTVRNPAIIHELKDKLDEICVSVDGYNEANPTFLRDPGIFERLMGTVRIFKDLGLQVSILPTIHAKNITRIEDYIALAEQLGVPISFSLLSANTEVFKEFIPTTAQLVDLSNQMYGSSLLIDETVFTEDLGAVDSCGAGRKLLSIGTDGHVYPCHALMYPDFDMGNMLEMPLTDILSTNPVAQEFAALTVDEISGCSSCDVKYFCGGYCRARAFYDKGSIYNTEPYCGLCKNYNNKLLINLEQYIQTVQN